MDKKLSRIVSDLNEYLDVVQGSGLYDGLMGTCICYFILGKVTGEIRYNNSAKKLLTKIQESIPEIDDFGFANGLSGIGWGVEWLVQNEFVKGNTDIILEDLDDVLYNAVVYAKDTFISLEGGSIGKAMYFLYRMHAKNPRPIRFRTVCNLECLVLLSDEIAEQVLNKKTGVLSKKANEIVDSEFKLIAQVLLLMLRIYNRKINTQIAIEVIEIIVRFFEKYILDNKNSSVSSRSGFLNLVHIYCLAAQSLGNEKRQNFTEESSIVRDCLRELGLLSGAMINSGSFEVNFNQYKIEDETILNSPGGKFLSILKNINSIKETSYGYEAFMLK